MLHSALKDFRQDLATDVTVAIDKNLPEVTGYKVAKSKPMQAAIKEYNKREYDACLKRQLARLANIED